MNSFGVLIFNPHLTISLVNKPTKRSSIKNTLALCKKDTPVLYAIIKQKEASMRESLQRTIKAFIKKGEQYYIAECLEVPVVTQGKTIDEVVANLKEAVALHLEDEDLAQIGLAPNPALIITMETEPLASVA